MSITELFIHAAQMSTLDRENLYAQLRIIHRVNMMYDERQPNQIQINNIVHA